MAKFFEIVNGIKTYIGGAGIILTAIYGYMEKTITFEAMLAAISGAITLMGLGHKVDKNTAAVKESGTQ